jgi:hypothetical protein
MTTKQTSSAKRPSKPSPTPDLNSFLISKNALDRFMTNMQSHHPGRTLDYHIARNPTRYLHFTSAFPMSETPEGYDYWRKLHDEYIK